MPSWRPAVRKSGAEEGGQGWLMALRCSASRGDECAPEQAQMREERRAEGLGAKGPRESPGTQKPHGTRGGVLPWVGVRAPC